MRSTTATLPGRASLRPGPALGITGGHCDDNMLAPEFKHSAEGVADGVDGVRRMQSDATSSTAST